MGGPAHGIARGVWLIGGCACVGLGAIGIVVPGLPTTVFFVMAAACFSRSSPRFEQWVLTRPGIGPMVREYRAGLGMPRAAKVAAVASIVAMCGLSAGLAVERWSVRVVIIAVGVAGVVWILWRIPTRPETAHASTRAGSDPAVVWFRGVAVAEAISWCGLLAGMFVKYVLDRGGRGVEIFGQVHGIVVIVYATAVLVMWRRQHWSTRILITGLLASVPPLGSIMFERWATRTGQLPRPPSPGVRVQLG